MCDHINCECGIAQTMHRLRKTCTIPSISYERMFLDQYRMRKMRKLPQNVCVYLLAHFDLNYFVGILQVLNLFRRVQAVYQSIGWPNAKQTQVSCFGVEAARTLTMNNVHGPVVVLGDAHVGTPTCVSKL